MRDVAARKVRLVEVETPAAVAVRPVAAVRLRRRVPLRGRRAAGRAPGRRAGPGLRRCSASCSAGSSCASCSTRRCSPRPSGSCSGWTEQRTPARRRGRRRAAARARRPVRRRSWPRGASGRTWLTELAAARRVAPGPHRRRGALDRRRGRRPAAATRWAWRCRSGWPRRYLEPVADPLGDLVARYARTHGAVRRRRRCAARFGLGVFVVEQALDGSPPPAGSSPASSPPGRRPAREWCDAEVLRLLRRRSLAALRREIEPVPPRALAAFLPALAAGRRRRPAASRRSPPRSSSCRARRCRPRRWSGWCCRPGSPTTPPPSSTSCAPAGEVLWAGAGRDPRRRRLGHPGVRRRRAAAAPAARRRRSTPTPLHEAVLDALADGQALFFRPLADRVGVDRRRRAGRGALGPGLGRPAHQRHARPAARALLGGGGAHRRPAAPRRAPATGRPGRPSALPTPRPGPPTVGRPLVPAARAGPRPDPPRRRARRRCCSSGTAW